MDKRLDEVRRRFNIQIDKATSETMRYLGRLYTVRGGFVIRIRKDVRTSTYRFVLSHEIAHTLVYDTSGSYPARPRQNNASEEKLCNMIARRLLLPEDLVGASLGTVFGDRDIDVSAVDQISNDFNVAPWQVLVRALEAYPQDKIAAILWSGPRPPLSGHDTQRSVRILESWSPPGIFIPSKDRSFKSAKETQLLWQTMASQSNKVQARDYFDNGSLEGELESICFQAQRRPDHLIQLIFLDIQHQEKAARWREVNL